MTTAQLQDISMNRPLVISSYGELCDVLKVVLTDAGVLSNHEEDKGDLTQSEYTTKHAKKVLKEKGYQVTSYPSFKALMDLHGMKPVRKGKDDWWNAAKINAIPVKS